MQVIECKNCGAKELILNSGYWVCEYCDSKFLVSQIDFGHELQNCGAKCNQRNQRNSRIELADDINRLLQKCKEDPLRASKYANLILDIDPDNVDALKYL